MPARLITNRNLATASAIAFLFTATFGCVLCFLTLYFHEVCGYDALETGVGFLPPTTPIRNVRGVLSRPTRQAAVRCCRGR